MWKKCWRRPIVARVRCFQCESKSLFAFIPSPAAVITQLFGCFHTLCVCALSLTQPAEALICWYAAPLLHHSMESEVSAFIHVINSVTRRLPCVHRADLLSVTSQELLILTPHFFGNLFQTDIHQCAFICFKRDLPQTNGK